MATHNRSANRDWRRGGTDGRGEGRDFIDEGLGVQDDLSRQSLRYVLFSQCVGHSNGNTIGVTGGICM